MKDTIHVLARFATQCQYAAFVTAVQLFARMISSAKCMGIKVSNKFTLIMKSVLCVERIKEGKRG